MTTTALHPAEYTHGLNEMIRAHRLYVGLSQRGMADLLHMDRRSYQRIENGTALCPPGLLTTIAELSDTFDSEVEAASHNAQARVDASKIDSVVVNLTPSCSEWDRSVVGRVYIESGLITPMMVGEQEESP